VTGLRISTMRIKAAPKEGGRAFVLAEHESNLERRFEAPFENSGQADATRTRQTALYLDAPLQIFSVTVCNQGLVVVTGYIKLCGL